MEIDAILTIIFIAAIVISIVSFFIWDLSKNKRIAKFFRKISEWILETISHSGV